MRNLMIGLFAAGALMCVGLASSPAKAAPPIPKVEQPASQVEDVRYRRRYVRRGYYGRRGYSGRRYYGRSYARGRYVRRPARRAYRRWR